MYSSLDLNGHSALSQLITISANGISVDESWFGAGLRIKSRRLNIYLIINYELHRYYKASTNI